MRRGNYPRSYHCALALVLLSVFIKSANFLSVTRIARILSHIREISARRKSENTLGILVMARHFGVSMIKRREK